MFTSDSGEQRLRAGGGRMAFCHVAAVKLDARATRPGLRARFVPRALCLTHVLQVIKRKEHCVFPVEQHWIALAPKNIYALGSRLHLPFCFFHSCTPPCFPLLSAVVEVSYTHLGTRHSICRVEAHKHLFGHHYYMSMVELL